MTHTPGMIFRSPKDVTPTTFAITGPRTQAFTLASTTPALSSGDVRYYPEVSVPEVDGAGCTVSVEFSTDDEPSAAPETRCGTREIVDALTAVLGEMPGTHALDFPDDLDLTVATDLLWATSASSAMMHALLTVVGEITPADRAPDLCAAARNIGEDLMVRLGEILARNQ